MGSPWFYPIIFKSPALFCAFPCREVRPSGILLPMNYDIILFDLDDTLYNGNTGLWQAIRDNIYSFMTDKLGIPYDEVGPMREKLFVEYGTTMRGLTEFYEFDMVEYMDYVHNLPLDQYLAPNPDLYALINKYSVKKYIFTNSDTNHAERVMRFMKVRDLFEQTVVDVISLFPYCKPMPEAFEKARQMTGNLPAEKIVFVDDSLANIKSAKALGFQTIWINKNHDPDHNFDFPVIYDILELENALPYNNRK